MTATIKTEKDSQFGEIFYQWQIKEYPELERSFWWFVLMFVVGIALVIYSLWVKDYLFTLIIILGAFITMVKIFEKPKSIRVMITEDGIIIGNQFFDYDQIKNFYLIYKPPYIKKLYLNMKNFLPDVSLSLDDIDPVALRTKLLDYLEEDLDKEYQSFDDQLENIFKL